jgi:16S rRNA (adenine1518-N6/adenine1519-N6)-dimethyltransferase
MTALPGSADYGRLTIMLAWRCRTEALFTVGPGAFQPPPKVQSAVVRLLPHRTPPFAVENADLFKRIVAQAFSQRRKTLRNALRGLIPTQAWMSTDVDPELRPEQVAPAEYARLTNAVMGFAPDGKCASTD